MRERDVSSRASERWTGDYDDVEGNESDELRENTDKHRSKDRIKVHGHREEKDRRGKDLEKSKTIDGLKEREKESSSKNRRKERDERERLDVRDRLRERDSGQDKHREKERDKERMDHGKEREHEREREKEFLKDGERARGKERGNESREREKDRERNGERGRDRERGNEIKEKDKERVKERDKVKDREREKHKDKEREREIEIGRDKGKDAVDRDKGKERNIEKEMLSDKEKDRMRDRDRSNVKLQGESRDSATEVEKNGYLKLMGGDLQESQSNKEEMGNSDDKKPQSADNVELIDASQQTLNLEERIVKMKEERLKKSSEGSEISSWLNRSRKLEEIRLAEKEKAMQLSRVFEEQDNLNDEESDDDMTHQNASTVDHLAGVKVLHGLDKVLEGGAIVLTLKDQSILLDGGINEDVDMLENVEIGEQKRRTDAYRAAKKTVGVYDDKFNDDPGAEKKMLPQYDDPVADEGVTLDSSGRFTGDAERKLEELRRRIQGTSARSLGEDLTSAGKISTDYYTQEEMMKFKKPKKKKSLRKRGKLDIDALEAEAISAGLGTEDLGSRNDGRRQNLRREQEKAESEMRSHAFQMAYAKAEEASKALREDQIENVPTEEDDTFVFGDDDDELRKSLERARKIALKKQDEEVKTLPQTLTLIANISNLDSLNSGSGEQLDNKVVFTEMEEFVGGLQLNEETQKPVNEDVFMEEDMAPSTSDQEMKDEDGGWAEVKEPMEGEILANEEEEVAPDGTIHESAVGKGLAGALKLLKDRGALKETIEWGGRNMDKKKSKLIGIYDDNGQKEIHIERTDEYGRILTPKESFRLLSHKFHGKGPGKMKQEKRMRQYQEELKIKQMKNADTPSLSVERMREAQAKLQTPFIVLSGHVKPSDNDPRNDFTSIEKDLTGGLTPMLGNKKVEHFLNIKRKFEPGDNAAEKKPKN